MNQSIVIENAFGSPGAILIRASTLRFDICRKAQ